MTNLRQYHYGLMLCRTVFWYDSAEYVTAAVTLGIPYPPGFPLCTIVGHAFTWLPIEPALAVRPMSSTFGAVVVALTYLVCRRLRLGRIPSGVAAATLGGGELFWSNAVIARVCHRLPLSGLLSQDQLAKVRPDATSPISRWPSLPGYGKCGFRRKQSSEGAPGARLHGARVRPGVGNHGSSGAAVVPR
jgi:hypothetical protein